MKQEHHYELELEWTGNKGQGTTSYRQYSRDHQIYVEGKSLLRGSADPNFLGNPDYYNPEELFLASIASCHMLWFLHLCAENGVIVSAYTDNPKGIMEEQGMDGGKFREVLLLPSVTVTDVSMLEKTKRLHEQAHSKCFIANSCNFPIRILDQAQLSSHKP